MKYKVVLVIIFAIAVFSCNKKSEKNINCPVELTIISTQTPATATLGNDIVAEATCAGANLCCSFSHVEIKTINERIYEVRTKGTFPCKATICADAIYYAKPSFSIRASLTGQYILRYYNNNTLFKADTVAVN